MLTGKYFGGSFHDGDAKEAFGLDRKAKWPEHGMDPRRVQGVTMWVQEVGSTPLIRALCKCPACGKTVAIGRLNQHAKIHRTGKLKTGPLVIARVEKHDGKGGVEVLFDRELGIGKVE